MKNLIQDDGWRILDTGIAGSWITHPESGIQHRVFGIQHFFLS
jgi:hypothetical protein